MTNEEIRHKIDSNNKEIEEAMSTVRFTLNKRINALLEENRQLRKECNHKFVEGYCIYCDTIDPNAGEEN
jgi:hypothetical protein